MVNGCGSCRGDVVDMGGEPPTFAGDVRIRRPPRRGGLRIVDEAKPSTFAPRYPQDPFAESTGGLQTSRVGLGQSLNGGGWKTTRTDRRCRLVGRRRSRAPTGRPLPQERGARLRRRDRTASRLSPGVPTARADSEPAPTSRHARGARPAGRGRWIESEARGAGGQRVAVLGRPPAVCMASTSTIPASRRRSRWSRRCWLEPRRSASSCAWRDRGLRELVVVA